MNATIEHLWQTFAGKLAHFIRARVNDAETAADLRQDVFLKLQKQLRDYGSLADTEAWLYRTTRHAIIDYYRTRKPTEEIPETLQSESAPPEFEVQELMASFRRMILSLPEPYREAVILADLEGWKQEAVAQRLGLTLSGAKSRIQRGRQLLKKMLDDCCVFEFDQRGRVLDCQPRTKNRCEECESKQRGLRRPTILLSHKSRDAIREKYAQ